MTQVIQTEVSGDPTKPYLLLDVDGVLNPLNSKNIVGYNAHYFGMGVTWLNPKHGEWINSLCEYFNPVWATSWLEDAPNLIAPVLGLPEMPVIDFSLGKVWELLNSTSTTWKLVEVKRFIGDTPCAWIDDELFTDAFQWARRRESPTLLVRPNATFGLTYEQCTTIEDFGVRCREQLLNRLKEEVVDQPSQ